MTEAFVSPDGKQVVVGGNEFEVEIADPKRLRSVGSESEYVDGVAEIKTAMPGKVVRILVKVGAAVEKGDGVIVVEAMKMQNEMKSPKTGTVTKINATEGDTVNAGDVLAVIE
ncbi:MAG: biotin/lipoyl-binding protein [Chloracidobacterium sp.]|nr:biotin/lipoyl-binding protein [Chloracidobacterium sp.]